MPSPLTEVSGVIRLRGSARRTFVQSFRHAAGLVTAASAVVVLAACGSSTAVTTGAAPVSRSTPDPAAVTSAASTPGVAAAANTATVKIVNFAFTPKTLHVRVGTTVRWVNNDTANHTVTGRGFHLGNVNQRASVSKKFKLAGRFSYVCDYHPFMKGTVVVTK